MKVFLRNLLEGNLQETTMVLREHFLDLVDSGIFINISHMTGCEILQLMHAAVGLSHPLIKF